MPLYIISYDLEQESEFYEAVIKSIESGQYLKLLNNVWAKVANEPHSIVKAISDVSKGKVRAVVTEFNPHASCYRLSRDKISWLKEHWNIGTKWDFFFADDED